MAGREGPLTECRGRLLPLPQERVKMRGWGREKRKSEEKTGGSETAPLRKK